MIPYKQLSVADIFEDCQTIFEKNKPKYANRIIRQLKLMLKLWDLIKTTTFHCSYANGFTEVSNNKIKVIKRNGYGFRNFENFRNRILLSMH